MASIRDLSSYFTLTLLSVSQRFCLCDLSLLIFSCNRKAFSPFLVRYAASQLAITISLLRTSWERYAITKSIFDVTWTSSGYSSRHHNCKERYSVSPWGKYCSATDREGATTNIYRTDTGVTQNLLHACEYNGSNPPMTYTNKVPAQNVTVFEFFSDE